MRTELNSKFPNHAVRQIIVLMGCFCIFNSSAQEITVDVSFKCDSIRKAKVIYKVKDNKVWQIFSSGTSVDGKPVQPQVDNLDNCRIMDERNWTCGGNISTKAMLSKTAGKDPTYSSVNGKFSYDPGFNTFLGDPKCPVQFSQTN